MRIKRRLKNDKFAVSVVIGVVLLVAVSVSLSGAVLIYVTEMTDKQVTDGLEQNIIGIATSDGTVGTLQFAASTSDADQESSEFEFIVTDPDGETVVITPEDIDMTSSGVAAGDVVNIKSLVEEAFDDRVESGEYTVTCRNTDEIFTKRIIGEYSFDLTFESNKSPNEPSIPSPATDATAISINADLSWTGGDLDLGDTATYDVYFGTLNPPPMVENNQSAKLYDLGTLDYEKIYYWKIVAWDNHGDYSEGSIWSFTAEEEPNSPPYLPSDPGPEDGVTNKPITARLSWTGGDPDHGDTVTYDVYFGTTASPPLVESNTQQTTYGPTMGYSTTYYWKIVSWDDHGASTDGRIWRFTTKSKIVGVDPIIPDGPIDGTGGGSGKTK